ncbi:MAG: CPBP family intramembrane glutamic endopeptidase [Bacteroidota bacterium]
MKAIFKYLRTYISEHFNAKLYLSFAVFISVLISINYYLDFEDQYIDQFYGSNLRIPLFFLIHALGYYGTLLIVIITTGRKEFIYQKHFWVKSLLGFLILGIDRSFHYHMQLKDYLDLEIFYFAFRIAGYLSRFLTIFFPLLILYYFYDRKEKANFYGLTTENVNFKPYWAMFFIVCPFIFAASFLPDFLKQYPIYKYAQGHLLAHHLEVDEWVPISIFETTYLSGFLHIELFFRGFLILGLARYLDKDVVLPMAATYAVLHFGKPLGETIGSIFGGYILGIVALYSRNIWGGIFIHIGVAFFMEAFAFMQHRLFK